MKNKLLNKLGYNTLYISGDRQYDDTFKHTQFNFIGKYKAGDYRKGDIVYDNIGYQKFYILKYNTSNIKYNNPAWTEFYDNNYYKVQNFIDITKKTQFWIKPKPEIYAEIELDDNTRLDFLSYINYNTTDNWDILFLLNNMDHVDDLPSSTDIIDAEVNIKLKEWASKFKYTNLDFTCLDNYILEGKFGYYDGGNFVEITDEDHLYYLNKLYDAYIRITKEMFELNEKHRIFKMINPVYIDKIEGVFKQ